MFKLTYFKRLLLVIMALMLVACSGGEEEAPAASSSGGNDSAETTTDETEPEEEAEPANTDPIKIGAIHDLTGPTSDVGTPYAEGIRDYVKFINENGGVGGRQIDLLSQDYAYSVPEADQLYSQYVSEGVVAFQGWGTGDTEALKGKVADDEIPFMSASYSAPLGHPEEAPYNFLVGTSYSDQFIIALKHAQENGADTVVILHHDSPFGTSPVQDGIDWGNENGMTVTSIPMPGGATDFTAELTQVKDSGAQYIVIQNVSSPSATLTKDVDRLGMDIGIICLNWCSDELFIELAGDAAEGVVAASPFAFPSSGAPLIEDEIRPWAEANGIDVDEKGVHYAQGWTTMRLMVDGIQKVVADGDEVTGANIRAALETFTNYSTGGMTSPLTYTPESHTGNSSLELYEVQNGVHVKISGFVSPEGAVEIPEEAMEEEAAPDLVLEGDPIKIGAIHDLTGPTSDVGTPYAEGIRDYVKFVNDSGGVFGLEIDLLSQDYAYSVPEADQLYSQYVNEGVVAFQGWGTGDTEALKGKIADDEIPFMSASYSAPLGHPEEAPYNFLVGTSYSDQFIIALKHAQENGADTVVILHHDSPFGTSPVQDGIDWADANGMTVTSIPMPGGATDFTAELTQVKDAGAQYIVIQNVSSPSATLTKDVARLGMDIGIICLNWCSDELFIELAGDAAEGVIAASPFAFPGSGAELIENEIRPWAEANGIDVDAKGVHYVQGWTTMRLMVDGIRKAALDGNDITGPNIRAALETFADYSTGGVTAPLTYTADNHTGNTSLELYEVQNGVHVKISDYVSP